MEFSLAEVSANAFLLKDSERIHMFEEAAQICCVRLNRPLDIYAHVGALSTDEAIEMARAAKSAGIKHIASTPPFYFSLSQNGSCPLLL